MKTILFACVHNAGRSQMAAAFFNALADPAKAHAISAGTEPGDRVHRVVVDVVREGEFAHVAVGKAAAARVHAHQRAAAGEALDPRAPQRADAGAARDAAVVHERVASIARRLRTRDPKTRSDLRTSMPP